jgi:hypothetical protein
VSKSEYAKRFVVWHPPTGRKLQEIAIVTPPKPPSYYRNFLVAALSSSGKTLAMGGGPVGPLLRLHDTTTGKLRLEFTQGSDPVSAVAVAPDGRTLAVGTMKGLLSLHDAYTGAELGRAAGHQGAIRSIAFTPDSLRVITGSTDTTALVWNVADIGKKAGGPELDPRQLQSLWTQLGSDDGRQAYQAIGKLAAAKQAAAFLGQQVPPVAKVDTQRMAQLIADLDSARFEIRQQASLELTRLGELAEPELKRALAGKPSLDVKRRIEELLHNLHGPVSDRETLRQLRAVETLEALGTLEARTVLQKLSQGAPGARLTREARAALDRLATLPTH